MTFPVGPDIVVLSPRKQSLLGELIVLVGRAEPASPRAVSFCDQPGAGGCAAAGGRPKEIDG